jgi:hypothetical protein
MIYDVDVRRFHATYPRPGLPMAETKNPSKSMQTHRSSAHRLELLFIKEPRRYGASLTSKLPNMPPSPSNIRLSADYHQYQYSSKPSSVPIFYNYSPIIAYERPLTATEL